MITRPRQNYRTNSMWYGGIKDRKEVRRGQWRNSEGIMITSGTDGCLLYELDESVRVRICWNTWSDVGRLYIFVWDWDTKRKAWNINEDGKWQSEDLQGFKNTFNPCPSVKWVSGQDYPERGARGPLCASWGEGNCVFLWEGSFVRSTVSE